MATRVLSDVTLVPHRDQITAAHALSLVDATAEAGFDAVSLWSKHHDWAVADGVASEAFFEYHASRGVTTPFVEVLVVGADLEARGVEQAGISVLEVARRARARSVVAVTLDPAPLRLREVAAALAHVCDLAASDGLAVSFEFLPWTGVPDLRTTAQLFDAVDRPNLGLVLDSWHWHRQPGGPDLDGLWAFAPDRIHLLQLNDAPARRAGDLRHEAQTARLLPGAGAIDIDALVSAVERLGAYPVVAAEVFSNALADLGPVGMARRVFAATDAVMRDRLGWGATSS